MYSHRIEYYANGKKSLLTDTMVTSSGAIVNHGEYYEYYENGFVKIEGHHLNNKRCGRWYYYGDIINTSGRLDIRQSGCYECGKRVGTWRTYSSCGDIICIQNYPDPNNIDEFNESDDDTEH